MLKYHGFPPEHPDTFTNSKHSFVCKTFFDQSVSSSFTKSRIVEILQLYDFHTNEQTWTFIDSKHSSVFKIFWDLSVFHWPSLLKFRSSSTWESRHAMIMVHTLNLLIASASKRHTLLIYSFVLLSSDHIHHWRVPNNWTVLWFCSGNWSNQCLGVDVNECWLTIMMWSADGVSSPLQHKRFAKSIFLWFYGPKRSYQVHQCLPIIKQMCSVDGWYHLFGVKSF